MSGPIAPCAPVSPLAPDSINDIAISEVLPNGLATLLAVTPPKQVIILLVGPDTLVIVNVINSDNRFYL